MVTVPYQMPWGRLVQYQCDYLCGGMHPDDLWRVGHHHNDRRREEGCPQRRQHQEVNRNQTVHCHRCHLDWAHICHTLPKRHCGKSCSSDSDKLLPVQSHQLDQSVGHRFCSMSVCTVFSILKWSTRTLHANAHWTKPVSDALIQLMGLDRE